MLFFTIIYYFKMEKSNANRFIIYAALIVIIGVILGSPQIISAYELSKDAWRVGLGYEYFTEYSFPPFMVLTFFFPFLFGGGYGGEYWGAWNLTEVIGFVGILPLILSVIVFVKYRKNNIHILFWGIAAIITFILAMGGNTPIYKLFYYIPVYNMFKVPARHWLEFGLAIAILFAFGLQYLIYKNNERKLFSKNVIKKYVISIFTVLFLLLASKSVLTSAFIGNDLINPLVEANLADSLTIHNKAIYIPLVFMVAYFVWLLMIKYRPLDKKIITITITVLVGLEAFSFGRYYDSNWLQTDEGKIIYQQADFSLEFLDDQTGRDRSFYLNDRQPQLFNVPLNISKLNGYDPLINNNMNGLLEMGPDGQTPNADSLLHNNLILSMLNVRYIVTGVPLDLNTYLADNNQDVVLKELPLERWNNFNSESKGNGIFNLISEDGTNISLIEHNVTLKPNTYYKISFNLKTNEINDSPVTIDFYGEGYDNANQELSINPVSNQEEYSYILNSGSNLPEQTVLRFFTGSQHSVEVGNISVSEMEGHYPPIMKDVDSKTDDDKIIQLYNQVYSSESGVLIYENMNALPKIYSVNELIAVKGISEVKENLMQYKVNPNETAMVSIENLERIGEQNFVDGELDIIEYNNDDILVNANFTGQGFAVLADQYTKDWKVYIDGEKAELYEVNGLVRGVVVPEGQHEIEFKYEPWNLYIFMIISAVTFISLLVAMFIIGKRNRKKVRYSPDN